jgi:hypothetical protein
VYISSVSSLKGKEERTICVTTVCAQSTQLPHGSIPFNTSFPIWVRPAVWGVGGTLLTAASRGYRRQQPRAASLSCNASISSGKLSLAGASRLALSHQLTSLPRPVRRQSARPFLPCCRLLRKVFIVGAASRPQFAGLLHCARPVWARWALHRAARSDDEYRTESSSPGDRLCPIDLTTGHMVGR